MENKRSEGDQSRMGCLSGWEIRTRMIAAVIWLIGILFCKEIYSPWILTGILLIFMAVDKKISMRKIGNQMRHVMPFLILMLVTLSISEGIPPRQTAVVFALLLCSRVVIAVLVILAMAGGKEAEEFIISLSVLPIPQTYLSLLLLTNRYVHLLVREFRHQMMAMRSRMFVPKANPAVLKNIGYVVGGMFIRSYDRSEQVYAAMKSRCYTGVIPFENPQKPGIRDILKTVLAVGILASVLILERQVR